MISDFAVALFRTNSAAVRAERILWEQRRAASELIRAAGLEAAAIYRLGTETAADPSRSGAA